MLAASVVFVEMTLLPVGSYLEMVTFPVLVLSYCLGSLVTVRATELTAITCIMSDRDVAVPVRGRLSGHVAGFWIVRGCLLDFTPAAPIRLRNLCSFAVRPLVSVNVSLPIRINRGFCSGPGLAGFVPMVSTIHGPDPGLRIFSRRRVVGFTCNGVIGFLPFPAPSEVPVVIWGAPGCAPPGFGAGLVAGGWLPAGFSCPPWILFAKALFPCRFCCPPSCWP